MPEPIEFRAKLERLASMAASEEDQKVLRQALLTGKLAIASGERAVAIGGHANDAVITTGNYNVVMVFKGGDATAIRQEIERLCPPRLHQLHRAPSDFTGRRLELGELERLASNRRSPVIRITGLGGVGKTTLARRLAEILTPKFPDAQLYLDLGGTSGAPIGVREAMARVVRAFYPLAPIPEKNPELEDFYRSLFHERRVLLFLDDASDALQVAPLVTGLDCAMIVTSRQDFVLPDEIVLRLKSLHSKDAESLLFTLAPRIGALAVEFAAVCGSLPLALRLAAGALNQRVDIDPSDYLNQLQAAEKQLMLVDSSLALSWVLLTPESQQALSRLAVFPASFEACAAASIWDVDAESAKAALGILLGYSLLEWIDQDRQYLIHRLVRVFAASHLTAEDKVSGERRHARYFLKIVERANEQFLEGSDAMYSGVALFDREWSNIQVGRAWAEQRITSDEDAARLCNEYAHAGANLLELRTTPNENILHLELAITAARRIGSRSSEARHLCNQGIAYGRTGEYALGIARMKTYRDIALELGDRSALAKAMLNLGNLTKLTNDGMAAFTLFEQALGIARDAAEWRIEAKALGNMGAVRNETGDCNQAIVFESLAVAIYRERKDFKGEAMMLNNIGVSQFLLGRSSQAEEYYAQALAIADRINDRSQVATIRGSIGNIWLRRGMPLEALKHYGQQLTAATEFGDRDSIVFAQFNMSRAYAESGARELAVISAKAAQRIAIPLEHRLRPAIEAQLALLGSPIFHIMRVVRFIKRLRAMLTNG